MHDNQLSNIKGWPDVDSSPSVVRCFKQSVSVTQPAALAGLVWDLYVNSWPMIENYPATTYVRAPPPIGGNNSISALVPPVIPASVGGITGYAVATGGLCNLGGAGVPQVFALDSTPFNLTDPGRILGMGIEGINTTAVLNRQGTTTVYRMPQGKSTSSTYALPTLPAGSQPGYVEMCQYSLPPNSIANAMLLAGSRQWKAEEGAYCVCAFTGQDNPPRSSYYTTPVFLTTLDDDNRVLVNASTMLGPQPIIVGLPGSQPFIMAPVRTVPMHMSGMIFSGLSPSTTITINWNVYYETFPNPSSDLVTLARPSCVYDPVALELLSRILNELAVGVPSGDNWDGAWFADVVKTLSRFAAPIGLALGGPAGAAVGSAVGMAGDALSNYLAAPSAKKAQRVAAPKQRQQQNVRKTPTLNKYKTTISNEQLAQSLALLRADDNRRKKQSGKGGKGGKSKR
jgi:hypothetical protein